MGYAAGSVACSDGFTLSFPVAGAVESGPAASLNAVAKLDNKVIYMVD
ncbi:hypothetical protein MAGR_41140 [Mycolicibacterium agri]|uniref:Uncharacterized protein n=1 Tax=Mycolicibacterium agri TaxID=36811 RepID=A0A7I9W4U4_MYCAG|nr:hypothetical protein MAGR_41140 [Mycolicibacterium agri]